MSELPFLKYKNHPLTEKLVIVTATKGSGTELLHGRPLGIFLEKSGWEARTKIVENNREGLCKVYNRFLTEEYKDKYVIFIHDDVLINDLFFEEKVLAAFEKFDIIGLAGATSCDLSSEHPAWHMIAPSEHYVGEVAHSKDGRVWTTVFGPTDSRALVIDSLFMGVNVNKALEKGLKFDERFDFHHLDIDFSLEANRLKIKTGVFPLSVTHFGLGDSMNTDSWKKSSIIFKEKYK